MPEPGGSVAARFGNSDYQTQATGTCAASPLAHNWPGSSRIFFSDSDRKSYASVVVPGQVDVVASRERELVQVYRKAILAALADVEGARAAGGLRRRRKPRRYIFRSTNRHTGR